MLRRLGAHFPVILFLLLSAASALALVLSAELPERCPAVIPLPHLMTMKEGFFHWHSQTPVITSHQAEAKKIALYLMAAVSNAGISPNGLIPSAKKRSGENAVYLTLAVTKKSEMTDESYSINITSGEIRLKANHPAGLFYAVQTLRQIISTGARPAEAPENGLWLPCLVIRDKPAFSWRGMHLDVSRHFMDKTTVLRFIEHISLYRFNRFHWHLTDDQGWRIPIRAYPRLTEIGAWREENSGDIYGGFYSPEDIAEIVAFAADRQVMIIPEIDMPGHCTAALAAYPEFSCSGGPFKVTTHWGVHKDVFCVGNEKTFAFLENILEEVMTMFPAPYIHIGGDECPPDRWKECPRCLARLNNEKLDHAALLQGYFLRRVAAFLQKNRRIPIGWDEITEGGAPANTIIQFWRGMDGVAASLRNGHPAIVSPSSHTYLNQHVRDLSLKNAYLFQPLPPGLSRKEKKIILGGEGCIWSEYITVDNLDKNAFPRLIALAEVFWSHPRKPDFPSFHQRLARHYPMLKKMAVVYGPEARPVTITPVFKPAERIHLVSLETGSPETIIRYTVDGAPVTLQSPPFRETIMVKPPLTLTAAAFNGELPFGEPEKMEFITHAALGKRIQLTFPYSPKYAAGGDYSLCDGLTGSENFNDGIWQGYEGADLIATIDMMNNIPLRGVSVSFYHAAHSWIFRPTEVIFEGGEDGAHYTIIGVIPARTPENSPEQIRETFSITPTDNNFPANRNIRFIRITARNRGVNPSWHYAPGQPCWLFADEIIVR